MDIKIRTLLSRQHENKWLEKMIPVLAVGLALFIAAIVIMCAGKDPLYAFQWMIYGAIGTKNYIGETLAKTVPLLICSLGLGISFKANLTSIGAEGQMMMGGLFGSIAALYLPCPAVLRLVLVLLSGAVGGGIWGAVPGYLKARFGISEIINTIMMNYIATYLVAYLLNGPIKDIASGYQQSYPFPDSARMPVLIAGTRLHMGIMIGLILVFAYYMLMNKTAIGYRIRSVGYNPEASRYAGIQVTEYMVMVLVLSGAFAGIAGAIEVSAMHGRLLNGFTANVGFDAIAIALLGKLTPMGILIASLFFGALRVGSNSMQISVQVPSSLVDMIQGMIILFILCDKLVLSMAQSYKMKKESKSILKKEAC